MKFKLNKEDLVEGQTKKEIRFAYIPILADNNEYLVWLESYMAHYIVGKNYDMYIDGDYALEWKLVENTSIPYDSQIPKK